MLVYMIAILTGDIINSRSIHSPDQWLKILKEALKKWAKEPQGWEVYRGDSFQLEINDPAMALQAALYIKASLKTLKKLDVRIAIGLGTKSYEAATISESNGEAFVRSGQKLETLKKEKQNLAIQTGTESLDEELNLYFKLALIAMDNWTPASAEFVKAYLDHEGWGQKELGDFLGISQSSVSERYSRAYLAEVMELNTFFIKKIRHLQTTL
jgi:hypothetical protein